MLVRNRIERMTEEDARLFERRNILMRRLFDARIGSETWNRIQKELDELDDEILMRKNELLGMVMLNTINS